MKITAKTGRRYFIILLAVAAAAVLLVCALTGGCNSKSTPQDETPGPEYIIPLDVRADEDSFSLQMIIRDCSANRVVMNLKSADKTISTVRRDISVTKQQGINLTLRPDDISGKVPPDVSAEVLLYAKANADDKLNEDTLDRAVVSLKDYVVQLSADTVYCVVNAMELSEKAELVSGVSGSSDAGSSVKPAGATAAIRKYGIPHMYFAYGASGVSVGDRTVMYPSASVLANTWNTALAEKTGAAMGSDAKHFNIDMLLMQSLDIQKNALDGRNYMSYSEDPILAGYMGAAYINGVQSQNVGVSAGVFSPGTQSGAFSGSVNNIIRERALREIYFTGYEIALANASPAAVTAYNGNINGVYAASAQSLMNGVLRNEWGYSGFILYENLSDDESFTERAAEAEFMLSCGNGTASYVIEAVNNGTVTESQLDGSCVNILRAIVSSNSFKGRNGGVLDTQTGASVAKEAASEGMVLLKNDNGALPAKGKKVAVFGNAQMYTRIGGTSDTEPEPLYETNFIQGLENEGFTADPVIKGMYAQAKDDPREPGAEYNPEDDTREIMISYEAAERAARDNDLAVVCISRQTGADADHEMRKGDFMLNERESELIDRVSEAFRNAGKTITVIINTGNPIETVSWADKADAILYTGLAGMETGNAAAEIISGAVNPSGKLAMSFPASINVDTEYGAESEDHYRSDIYTGYRFYESFKVDTAYPFGYGLSYTTFEYSDVNASSDIYTDSISVTVNVKNTGDTAGKETVQLYVKKPYSQYDEQPETVLASFAKTDVLEPGASQKVTLVINNYSVRSFDTEDSEWYVGEGLYTAYVAPSVKDTGSELLRIQFRVEDRIDIKSVSACVPAASEIEDKVYKRHGEDAYVPYGARLNYAAGAAVSACCAEGSHTPDNAVDSDTLTWWSPSGDCRHEYGMISVDIGEVIHLSDVILKWNSISSPYIVEVSLNEDYGWTEISRTETEPALYESIHAPSEAGYVRVRIMKGAGDDAAELSEIEIYAEH